MTPAATPAKSRYADGRSGAGQDAADQAQGKTHDEIPDADRHTALGDARGVRDLYDVLRTYAKRPRQLLDESGL